MANGTSPTIGITEELKQLTLDIINSNGLAVVNDTTTDVVSIGAGDGPSGPGTTAREVTCAKKCHNRLFCNQILKPNEHCLKRLPLSWSQIFIARLSFENWLQQNIKLNLNAME